MSANGKDSKSLDFVCDDKYIEKLKTYFLDCSQKGETQLDTLIESLNYVCEYGIMEGNKAKYLKMYTERANGLKDLILEYGKVCAKMAEEFLDRIDYVDKYLY